MTDRELERGDVVRHVRRGQGVVQSVYRNALTLQINKADVLFGTNLVRDCWVEDLGLQQAAIAAPASPQPELVVA
jgi:hypothetical protein